MSEDKWLDEVRMGGLAYISHVRRLLSQSERVVVEGDERQALLDFLNYTEEHLVSMWELVAEHDQHVKLTNDACERIREEAEYDE